jgi:hypothetical protein
MAAVRDLMRKVAEPAQAFVHAVMNNNYED